MTFEGLLVVQRAPPTFLGLVSVVQRRDVDRFHKRRPTKSENVQLIPIVVLPFTFLAFSKSRTVKFPVPGPTSTTVSVGRIAA